MSKELLVSQMIKSKTVCVAKRKEHLVQTTVLQSGLCNVPFFLLSDNAYGKTLRQYHGWVVRGVFAVSVVLRVLFFQFKGTFV